MINIQDIILIVQFILETLNPSEYQFVAADINSDGQLNISDVILIMNIVLGR